MTNGLALVWRKIEDSDGIARPSSADLRHPCTIAPAFELTCSELDGSGAVVMFTFDAPPHLSAAVLALSRMNSGMLIVKSICAMCSTAVASVVVKPDSACASTGSIANIAKTATQPRESRTLNTGCPPKSTLMRRYVPGFAGLINCQQALVYPISGRGFRNGNGRRRVTAAAGKCVLASTVYCSDGLRDRADSVDCRIRASKRRR